MNRRRSPTPPRTRPGGGRLSRFLRDETGSATVEFVLWVPLFGFLLALIADCTMVFMANARMWDVARDTTRRMALRIITPEEAEDLVRSRLEADGRTVSVTAEDGNEVVVSIAMPIEEVNVFGPLSGLLPGDLTARVVMLREPI